MQKIEARRRSLVSRDRFYGFSGDPFAGRIHFLTDGNAAAASGAAATAGAAAGDAGTTTQTPPDVIPRSEANKAFKDRDAAKAAARKAQATASLLATKLGIDPGEIELVETGDAENPFELKGDALEKLTATLTEAQKARTEALKRAGKWEDREKELNDAWTKKLQKAALDAEKAAGEKVTAASKKSTALEDWINEIAGVAPLREALAAENAVHDGTGDYSDLIALLKPRIKREIAVDEETGKASVKFVPMSEDGQTPLTDGKGNAATVRQLVSEWLNKRPHLKAAKFVRGPGAGGAGRQPTPGGAATQTEAERQKAGLARIFGKDIAEQVPIPVR